MLLNREYLLAQADDEAAYAAVVATYPERIIQVGEGNFLRGFIDWMVDVLNRKGIFQGRVVVVAPRPTGQAKVRQLNRQNGLYTVCQRGLVAGQPVEDETLVACISRAIDPYTEWAAFLQCAENRDIDVFVSNTTEAGIVYQPQAYVEAQPPISFPAKLTAYLYRRFSHFQGDPTAGMIILPCELIDNNAVLLRELVLRHADDWRLSPQFADWINSHVEFCSTLVDRIVTGYPQEDDHERIFAQIPYEDPLLTVCEPYHFFAIEVGAQSKLPDMLPFAAADLNVQYAEDITPYRVQKVRILNGTHTALAYIAHQLGLETVREAVADERLGVFVQTMLEREILPLVAAELPTIPQETLRVFAQSTLERFMNPYIRHRILDLTLNGLAKFKSRLLPMYNQYVHAHQQAPRRLALGLAAMLLFYKNAEEPSARWEIRDDPAFVECMQRVWAKETEVGLAETVRSLLAQTQFWGEDLNAMADLQSQLVTAITQIRTQGLARVLAMA